jgi:PAS domain S-box-containing protein
MEQQTILNKDDLRNAGSIYKRMIEEVQDYAIILLNKEGFIINWNKGAQKIKGYMEREIVGKHFSIFYLNEDVRNNLPQTLLEQAEKTGRAAHEGWRKRKDGTRFWGSITITAIHNDNGSVIGFCKVTRDLTDKKIAEDKLRMSEERYHQMIAEVQDYAIILLDPNGIIINWNTGAEQIKGYKASEAIGKRFNIFYTDEDRRNNLPDRLLKEAQERGKAVQEGWRMRKDGSRFWGTIVITALHNKEGHIIGFSKVTRDLTQQKIANDKIIAYTKELEIQNSDLEQFAYVASHDLQEPLRKIQTFSGLIQERYDDKEYVKKYFEKLDRSAKRMSELIKSLLNYSRLAKDKYLLQLSEVDLNEVIEDIKLDFELLIEEKQAIIVYEQLPAVPGNLIQLGQLFSNLISNSLKFTSNDPIIRISSSIVDREHIPAAPESLAEGQYYKIVVSDNGIGFKQKYNTIIFSLFQRLHGKHEYNGTGIGLALCKKIVENHKGYISAESEPGKGTRFNVYLPVQWSAQTNM